MNSIQKTTTLIFLFVLCILSIHQPAFCQANNNSRFNSGTSKGNNAIKATREVENHFKSMKYSYAMLSEDQASSKALKPYSGSGTITSRKGIKLKYKWYVTTDNKGNIVHMYVGDNRMTSFGGVLGITRSEHKRRKTACRGKSGEARKRCLDRLWVDTMTDCLLAFDDKSECKTDCWFRGGYCIK